MSHRGKLFSSLFSLAACAALLASPPTAQAQIYPPITGTVTVGVPSSITVTVPLELTVQMLANANPGMVLYSTIDGGQIFILSQLGFGADGVVTAGELLAVYPNAKVRINSFSGTLTGDSRFTLNIGTCAAPVGLTCTANANYNGAIPAGNANLTLAGDALSATVSGTGNALLESFFNAFLPTILSSFDQFLTLTIQVTVAKGSQAIVFGAAPANVAVGTTGSVSATGGASGNAVTFASTTPSICSISGTTVTGTAFGTCTISANQAGNTNYNAAPQVTQSFSVAKGSQAITFGTAPASIAAGTTGTVGATGGASGNPVTFSSTTPSTCSVSGVTVTGLAVGTCTIAANQAGNTNYNAAPQVTRSFPVAKGNQAITFGAAPNVTVGSTGTVSATGGLSGNPVVFASTTPSTCSVSGATVTGIAAGTCTISANQAGNTNYNAAPQVTQSFQVGADPDPPRLANISTRMQVLTGFDVMIGGFVIGGATTKRVAIVATGPSLVAYGIPNPLANPALTLVRSSDQAVIATNDDWQGGCPPGFACATPSQLTAAGFAPSSPLEAAILIDLAPGAYTAIVEGAGGGTGVAVIGVYEVDHPETPLINISTRGRVLTGFDVMIGGFVIYGSGPQTVAIVATGPSLATYGIPNPLPNPTITLVRSSDQAVIASNDDWAADAQSAQLQGAGFAPTNPLESGLYRSLAPGAYTVIVQGVGGGTGVGVIGVYKVN